MTNNDIQNHMTDLNIEITKLLGQFGPRRLIIATMKAFIQRKNQQPDAKYLDNRLRRDMGLPEIDNAPYAEPLKIWWGARF